MGLLDGLVVLGIREGALVTVPTIDDLHPEHTLTRSCALAEPKTQAELLDRAFVKPPRLPAKWILVGLDGEWAGFQGWRLPHCFCGDHSVLRLHLYSRSIEEHPSCATAHRGSRKPSAPASRSHDTTWDQPNVPALAGVHRPSTRSLDRRTR